MAADCASTAFSSACTLLCQLCSAPTISASEPLTRSASPPSEAYLLSSWLSSDRAWVHTHGQGSWLTKCDARRRAITHQNPRLTGSANRRTNAYLVRAVADFGCKLCDGIGHRLQITLLRKQLSLRHVSLRSHSVDACRDLIALATAELAIALMRAANSWYFCTESE